jgi:hypothetical protein
VLAGFAALLGYDDVDRVTPVPGGVDVCCIPESGDDNPDFHTEHGRWNGTQLPPADQSGSDESFRGVPC